VRADPQTEGALLDILERFCSGFATRDAEAVMQLFAPDADIVMVSSEEPLLRGLDDVRAFLQRYARGPTTYSWTWDRHDVSAAGAVAWLLAEGVETAAVEDHEQKHPYRMSFVCEKRDGRWFLVQIHGSSPHGG
jgi:uncharacterized protein (TIGR02246 family)